jgi:hypothetical protein
MKLFFCAIFISLTLPLYAVELTCQGRNFLGSSCRVHVDIDSPKLGNQMVEGRGLVTCERKREIIFEEDLTFFYVMGAIPSGFNLVGQGEIVKERIPQVLGHIYVEKAGKFKQSYVSFWHDEKKSFVKVKLKCQLTEN